MPIERISAAQALANLSKNSRSRWPRPEAPERLYPLATPTIVPKFRILPEHRVFCIGSCFAREVESALARLNFDVCSIVRDLPRTERRQRSDPGMSNKYTIASMLNELRWALDPARPYSHDLALIENAQGLFEDYHLKGNFYADDLQPAREFREAFNRQFRQVREADLIVMTLGLSEAWYDRETELVLNIAPNRSLVDKYPGRFELHVLGFEESLERLEAIYTLLTRFGKAGHQILLTVSPVPLHATFRNQDILVANTYSKAVLRAVAEHFQLGKDNVCYFPSFEFATLSHPNLVWGKRDLRHVDRNFVEHIMSAVIGSMMEPSRQQLEMSALAQACALHAAKHTKEAAARLAPLMERPDEIVNPAILRRWALIQKQLKNPTAAIAGWSQYLERCPGDTKAQEALRMLQQANDSIPPAR